MNTGKRLFSPLLCLLALPLGLARAQEEGEPLRYARVGVEDARIVNLPDANGIVLARPTKDTVLSVWRELSGWLEVEQPGGYQAWVHGRYLARAQGDDGGDADVPGVHEITRNAINIRPLPNSEVTSFPLPQRLHSGDRVLVLALDDPAVPLAETWARIVTPPGVRAWIRSDQVTTIAGAESGAELWRAAVAAAAAAEPRVPPREPARGAATGNGAAAQGPAGARPTGAIEEAQRAELERLRAAVDAEREKDAPAYAPLADELRTLSLKTTGALRLEIDGELARLAALEEVAAVRAELERERQRREEELWRRERSVREASRSKDPLGSVFRARGVLLRNVSAAGEASYRLRFGGRDVCTLACTSGRYDLDLFAGYEIGVFGDQLDGPDGAPFVDVRRVEIVKRR